MPRIVWKRLLEKNRELNRIEQNILDQNEIEWNEEEQDTGQNRAKKAEKSEVK